MDESQSLDALANILTELAEKPFDISMHAQHIRLAQSLEGMDSEVHSAMEMLSNFYAAGEDIWLTLIKAKESAVDLHTANGVGEVLALYARAEADYLSIPILKAHIEFILGQYALYANGETPKPDELGDLFSKDWTREAVGVLVQKGAGHLTQSHLLFDQQRDWELEVLEGAPKSEQIDLVEHIRQLLLTRLRQPHSNSDETFQAYSSFTTKYQPPDEYEILLVDASKTRVHAVKAFERRDRLENDLVQSKFSLDAYQRYITYESRARNPDLFVMGGVYERAIAEAAKRRFDGEIGAEEFLRLFWNGYLNALKLNQAGEQAELDALRRAVRSIPGSGQLWARYIRYLDRTNDEEFADLVGKDTIEDVYGKAFGTNLLQKDVEEIVPVVLARAGFERRRVESGEDVEDAFATLIGVLENGLDMVRKASPMGDSRLRLEKFLAETYRSAELGDSAIKVWQTAAKHYKTSYLAWTSYTDALIKNQDTKKARGAFKDLSLKPMDWPEAIWEAYLAFEHLHGTVEDVEICLEKVEKAQFIVNEKRTKEAEKAHREAMQMQVQQQAASVSVADVPIPDVGQPMDVDDPSISRDRGMKRRAEEELHEEGSKKAKTEPKPAPLKRDRENSTVFVADLPSGVSDDELKGLFKDCGKVREVKITELPGALVATVEFFGRDAVPGALTKDKKKLRDQEISVHLAWQSTLYVTNFAESTDDATIRELFGKYGTIFDVRWPSKKFKNTRRFCYIQYTSPSSAQAALELHGHELEPDLAMNVYISNPERKKERTDQGANEREIYVAGLNQYTTQHDLQKLFKTYGPIKEVRMALNDDGNSKGFAFVEFEDEKTALAALEANNQELKKRRIAVTLSDSRARARNRNINPDTGLGAKAEVRSRSVRVRNLPPDTQEALLQQAMEKITTVKRVVVLAAKNEAVVELENASEAGKLLLLSDPVVFNGNTLQFSEEVPEGVLKRVTAPTTNTKGLFVPRTAGSRPRAGLGHARKPAPTSSTPSAVQRPAENADSSKGKGQDDFRKMLGGK